MPAAITQNITSASNRQGSIKSLATTGSRKDMEDYDTGYRNNSQTTNYINNVFFVRLHFSYWDFITVMIGNDIALIEWIGLPHP